MVSKLSLNTNIVKPENKIRRASLPAFTSNNLKEDTVSFSNEAKENKPLTEKQINKRIKDFSKVMEGQDIPQEVLEILKDPGIKVSPPEKTQWPVSVGIIRKALQRVLVAILPKKYAEMLVPKISPKPLSDIDTVSIKMNKLKILKNSDGLFKKKNDIYFVSFVSDGVNNPAMLKVETFKDIRKNDDLFDKGLQRPYTLYLSEEGKVPRLLDFRLLVMEDDKKDAKKATDILDAVTGNDDYQKVVRGITALISVASPPAAIFTLVDSAIRIIKGVIKCNEDDQMLYYAARFSKDFDNLGVGTYDNKYDKVELGYEIVAK